MIMSILLQKVVSPMAASLTAGWDKLISMIQKENTKLPSDQPLYDSDLIVIDMFWMTNSQ